jgi:hypothetical protein
MVPSRIPVSVSSGRNSCLQARDSRLLTHQGAGCARWKQAMNTCRLEFLFSNPWWVGNRDFLPAFGFLRLRQKPLHLTENQPVLFRGQGCASRVHYAACHVLQVPRVGRLEGCNSTRTGRVHGRGVIGRQNAGCDVEEGEAGVGEGRAPRSCDVRYRHSPSWELGKPASSAQFFGHP